MPDHPGSIAGFVNGYIPTVTPADTAPGNTQAQTANVNFLVRQGGSVSFEVTLGNPITSSIDGFYFVVTYPPSSVTTSTDDVSNI